MRLDRGLRRGCLARQPALGDLRQVKFVSFSSPEKPAPIASDIAILLHMSYTLLSGRAFGRSGRRG